MGEYINIDDLKKEIESSRDIYNHPNRVVNGVADSFRQDGRVAMCNDILNKLESLHKGLLEVNLEKEIEQFEEALHGFDSVTSDDCKTIAQHFFELGLNAGVAGRKEAGWEIYRREAAKDILAGIVSNKVYFAHPDDCTKEGLENHRHLAEIAAYTAIIYVDELVRQLQSLSTPDQL